MRVEPASLRLVSAQTSEVGSLVRECRGNPSFSVGVLIDVGGEVALLPLDGTYAFRYWRIRSDDAFAGLALGRTIQIELDDSTLGDYDHLAPGGLVVTPEQAYLTVRQSDQVIPRPHYVSVANWAIAEPPHARGMSIFGSWALGYYEHNGSFVTLHRQAIPTNE